MSHEREPNPVDEAVHDLPLVLRSDFETLSLTGSDRPLDNRLKKIDFIDWEGISFDDYFDNVI